MKALSKHFISGKSTGDLLEEAFAIVLVTLNIFYKNSGINHFTPVCIYLNETLQTLKI